MAQEGALTVSWYGHAMFTVDDGRLTVANDPVPPEVGYYYEPVGADLVLVSHAHYDHNFLAGVRGSPKVIDDAGDFEFEGLRISGFESFHDTEEGRERGRVVIFAWEQAGIRIAHFGDVGDRPEPGVIEELRGIDIAMMPVGGVFTVDARAAAELADEISPRIVLPMHYMTEDSTIELEPIEYFARHFKGPMRQIGDRSVVIKRDSIPSSPEAWVMQYKGRALRGRHLVE